MASVCACGDYFEVNDDGELCLIPGTMGLRDTVSFTGPGIYNFNKADYPWLARVKVRVQAAGGGSAGSDADPGELISRPGGGGGGYSETLIDVALLGATENVVVGAGGAGGTGNSVGASGGNSSFGGFAIAIGGDGGAANMTSGSSMVTNTGVLGGGFGTGDLTIPGGTADGCIRLTGAVGLSGGGGGSMLGAGGAARGTYGVGLPGRGFGGGAGGSMADGAAAFSGGDGANGIVIVELYG